MTRLLSILSLLLFAAGCARTEPIDAEELPPPPGADDGGLAACVGIVCRTAPANVCVGPSTSRICDPVGTCLAGACLANRPLQQRVRERRLHRGPVRTGHLRHASPKLPGEPWHVPLSHHAP